MAPEGQTIITDIKYWQEYGFDPGRHVMIYLMSRVESRATCLVSRN